MNKKKLEKFIKKDIQMIIPINPPEFDLSSIVPEVEDKKAVQNGFSMPLKRLLVLSLSLVFVILMTFTIGNQFDLFLKTTTTVTVSTSETYEEALNPVTEVNAKEYALPIVTASQLSFSYDQLINLSQYTLLIDDYIDLVNQYMNALEFSISPNETMTEILLSDREEYPYLVKLNGYNAFDEVMSYLLYYEVTKTEENETKIEGIVIINEKESHFTGKIENEESEEKIVLKIYQSDSVSKDYILTEFKLEDSESSYQVTIYRDNKKISSSKIKFETEDLEQKVKVNITNLDNEIDFQIKSEWDDNQLIIRGKYDITEGENKESGNIVISVIDNPSEDGYQYQYLVSSGDIEKTYVLDRVSPLKTVKTKLFLF